MEYSRNQKILWALGTVVVLFYALIPVVWIISLSLKEPTTIGDQNFFPRDYTLDNYDSVFEGGLGFNRALVISIGVGLFNVWRNVGLYDTWPGLILPYLSFALPLSIYTLSAFFREIPWDLEKAAQMDGATGMQAFRRVILPLAMPGVFTAGILVFISAWNDFLFANVLTSTDASRTAPVALSFFRGASQFTDPSGAIAAGAVVVTIPILIMVLIFQRRIVSGLTSGAVKG